MNEHELRHVSSTEQTMIRLDASVQNALSSATAMLERTIETSDEQIIRAFEAVKDTMKGCEARMDITNTRKVVFAADGLIMLDLSKSVSFVKDR